MWHAITGFLGWTAGLLGKGLKADCLGMIIGAFVVALVSFLCGGGLDHVIFVH